VFGDDPRIPKGRGKPSPDIYLLALEDINGRLYEDEEPITPAECLVLEDGIAGVTAGRRAGMRVAWVPHPGLVDQLKGKEAEILAGHGEEAESDHYKSGTAGDDWGEQLASLERFSFMKYGIPMFNLD
jgi:pseudouridine-5'-monophosphatase